MKNKINTKYILSLLFITLSISSASAMNTDISHVTYRLIFKKIDDENRSYRRKCILNGKTIGYIRYNPAPTGAYIQKLFVENEYRNLGIGSTLFIMTLTHIKKLGSPVAQWHTKAAKNFYLPFGARTIKENNNGLDQMEYSFSQDGNPKENLKRNKQINSQQ